MVNTKNKNLIMFGMIIGIAFFFIGAMVNNIFPSSETDLLSYKISASIKLIGIGALTASMVAGGITVEDVDKNLKMLLLLLGLVILIIYSVGSPSLEWQISGAIEEGDVFGERPTGYGVPGFETIITIIALFTVISIAKIKRLR